MPETKKPETKTTPVRVTASKSILTKVFENAFDADGAVEFRGGEFVVKLPDTVNLTPAEFVYLTEGS